MLQFLHERNRLFRRLILFLIFHATQLEIVYSCRKLNLAPDNFLSLDETATPGKILFTIPVQDNDEWYFSLGNSDDIGGVLREDLESYFRFKKFGNNYDMILNKALDLEQIYFHHSIKLQILKLLMTCSERGAQDETTSLTLHINAINEFAPTFVGFPFQKSIKENCPVGTVVFNTSNVTIDKDVNPSSIEISSFNLHRLSAYPESNRKTKDGRSYFAMINHQKGIITVSKNLDYEILSSIGETRFLLNISASDIHGQETFTTLQIDIVDVNDLPPEFKHPNCSINTPRSRPCAVSYQAVIKPGYTGILHRLVPNMIAAHDMDSIGDPIVYSLHKGPGESNEYAAKFSIDDRTGIVSVGSPIMKTRKIVLVVVATEKSRLARETQAVLTVIVRDKTGFSLKDLNIQFSKLKFNDTMTIIRPDEEEVEKIGYIFLGIVCSVVFLSLVLCISITVIMKKDRARVAAKKQELEICTLNPDNLDSYHLSIDSTTRQEMPEELDMPNSHVDAFIASVESSNEIVSTLSDRPMSTNDEKNKSSHNNRKNQRSMSCTFCNESSRHHSKWGTKSNIKSHSISGLSNQGKSHSETRTNGALPVNRKYNKNMVAGESLSKSILLQDMEIASNPPFTIARTPENAFSKRSRQAIKPSNRRKIVSFKDPSLTSKSEIPYNVPLITNSKPPNLTDKIKNSNENTEQENHQSQSPKDGPYPLPNAVLAMNRDQFILKKSIGSGSNSDSLNSTEISPANSCSSLEPASPTEPMLGNSLKSTTTAEYLECSFMPTTPAADPIDGKHSASSQLGASSTEVLSVLPLEQSSCGVSEDDITEQYEKPASPPGALPNFNHDPRNGPLHLNVKPTMVEPHYESPIDYSTIYKSAKIVSHKPDKFDHRPGSPHRPAKLPALVYPRHGALPRLGSDSLGIQDTGYNNGLNNVTKEGKVEYQSLHKPLSADDKSPTAKSTTRKKKHRRAASQEFPGKNSLHEL